MNTAVSGEATEAAAYLSVGAGERMVAPDRTSPILYEAGIPRTVADVATEAYRAKGPEGVPVSQTYRRRFGDYPPLAAVAVHIGLPALLKAQPTSSRAALVGALGDTLRRAGRRVVVCGDWQAVLVGMDRRGAIMAGRVPAQIGPTQFPGLLNQSDVLVVSADTPWRLRLYARALLPLATDGRVNLLIASVAPPLVPHQGKWETLGFLIGVGPEFAPHSVLTSGTTRTRGLVANVDIAPTILALEDMPPFPEGAGRAITSVEAPAGAWAVVDRLDRQVTAASKAALPVYVGYGLFAIGSGLLALLALVLRSRPLATVTRFLLLTASAVPLALLPVGINAPPHVSEYAAMTVGSAVALSAICLLIESIWHTSAFGLLLTATALVVAADATLGAPLVSHSLLSAYYLAGIRFYGVGNEYMGYAIGCALVGPSLLRREVEFNPYTAALYLFLTVALSVPMWGAKAGAAITCTVAFTLALIAAGNRPLRAWHVMAAFLLALAAVLAVAALDRARPEEIRTHIGGALATGEAHGIAPLAEIATRKIAMNAHIATNGYTLAALLGLVPIWLLLSQGRLGEQAGASLSARPAFARVLPAAGWGALTAFVFNDSGVVAALLLLAPVTAAVIESMLCDTSQSTTGQSGSASPSATNWSSVPTP
jgi:hypothetical protein